MPAGQNRAATLNRIPEQPVRLSPEQEECQHPEEKLAWDNYRGLFTCGECGAQLVIPELEEGLGLSKTE
jgi:hypothetical protein